MLLRRKKPNGEDVYVADVVSDTGNMDYVLNGVVIKDAPTKAVMVTAQSDLANLTGYEAGTIAYTAGFSDMWQLNASGTWVEI